MIKKSCLKILLLIVCLFTLSISTFAWDDAGHKLTTYIAWQRMSPDVREKAIKILLSAPEDSDVATFYMPFGGRSDEAKKREFFMLISTWADIIRDRNFKVRNENYHHSNWHYSDTFWTSENGQVKFVENPNEEGGKAVEKLSEFQKVLQNETSTAADKAIALAWILHLGGDIHQPLHTSARITDLEPKGDQGGNFVLLTPKDTPRDKQVNLHWFWDSIIGRNVPLKNDACDSEYLPPIADKIMKKHPFAKMQNRLKLGQFDEWQKESLEVAINQVFSADLKRFEMPSENYKKKAFSVAQEQIALAGYRLGEMLNQIFGNQTMARTETLSKK